MNRRAWVVFVIGLLCSVVAVGCGGCGAGGSGRALRLSTTTSVKDSGLLAVLLPKLEERTGRHVEVQAVGSGKALELLQAGGADVAITHAPALEARAVSEGWATRLPFMHNEFLVVGPKDLAAGVAGAGDVRAVLRSIAASGKKFLSRADGSGTHQRERELWKAAGIAEDAPFIVQARAGMADTLKRASDEEAFTLADRGTFVAQRKGLELVIVFQGDEALKNVYSVMLPVKGEGADGAKALADFVRSPEGRAVIGGFGVEQLGEPLFTPEP